MVHTSAPLQDEKEENKWNTNKSVQIVIANYVNHHLTKEGIRAIRKQRKTKKAYRRM